MIQYLVDCILASPAFSELEAATVLIDGAPYVPLAACMVFAQNSYSILRMAISFSLLCSFVFVSIGVSLLSKLIFWFKRRKEAAE